MVTPGYDSAPSAPDHGAEGAAAPHPAADAAARARAAEAGRVAAPCPDDVTIVIVAYETPAHLTRCLDSLARDRLLGRLPVCVIDNSSSDACARVAGARDGVELVRNPRNVGYARAVNQGIARARTPFVLVLNPDIEVRAGAVAALRRAMDGHPRAGIVAARLLNPDGSLQYSCRRFYTLRTILLRRTFLGRLFPDHRIVREHLMADWDHADTRDVDWVLGACLMVRRRAIDEVGAMDERFFLYFEDVDWCARMHHHDWQVLYVPQAVMIHHHRRDSARGGVWSPSARMHLESVVRFYEKWSLVLYVLKRNRAALRTAALLLADLAAVNTAFLVAFGTRKLLAPWFEKPLFAVADYWQFLLVNTIASLLALRAAGLYRAGRPVDPLALAVKITSSLVIAGLAVLVSTFLFDLRAYSRFVLVLDLPLAIVAVTALRVGLARMLAGMAGQGLVARRVLLLGDRSLATWMVDRLARAPRVRYEIVGLYDRASELLAGSPADTVERIRRLCHRERVGEIVVADEGGALAALARSLQPLAGEGVGLRMIGGFSRHLGPDVAVDGMAGVPVLVPGGERGGPVASALKRAIDLVVALVLLVPVGLAAIWIRAVAALGAGRIEERGRPALTAAGTVAWLPAYRASGSAAGAEPLLVLARELWDLLLGRLSLVGIRRYTSLPGAGEPLFRAARPGLLVPGVTPAASGTAADRANPWTEKCLAADRAYVIGWSPATDLRVLLDAVRRRRQV